MANKKRRLNSLFLKVIWAKLNWLFRIFFSKLQDRTCEGEMYGWLTAWRVTVESTVCRQTERASFLCVPSVAKIAGLIPQRWYLKPAAASFIRPVHMEPIFEHMQLTWPFCLAFPFEFKDRESFLPKPFLEVSLDSVSSYFKDNVNVFKNFSP